METMTNLSPATQTVWRAYEQVLGDECVLTKTDMEALAAALAQPEPVAPTDEELDEFAVFWWGSDTDERTVTDVIECCSMTAYARAVFDRWGTPNPITEELNDH